MAANDRAGAAASHKPSSAGVISLDDRRRAVLDRRQRARDEAEWAELRAQVVERIDHIGELIEASKRAHPSNPRIYDHQQEEQWT